METGNSRYIGLFIQDAKSLTKAVHLLCSAYSPDNWLYITDELSPPKLRALFEKESIDLKNSNIQPSSDFTLRDQVVRAKPVIQSLEQKAKQLADQSIVVFMEMTWAVRTPSGDIYLRELQAAFQQFLLRFPSIKIVCIYNESILLDDQLLLGLVSHPLLFVTDKLKKNPYFLPSSIVMQNRQRERFEFWLSRVDEGRTVNSAKQALNTSADRSKKYILKKSIQTRTANSDEGRWKIRCFGELRIHRNNGVLIDWRTKAGATKKLKTVFAYLLMRGEKGASGEQLADLLWPDAPTTKIAMNRLYHTIRYLRKVLSGTDDAANGDSFLVNQNSMYYLQLPYDSWVDLPMFRELCAKGKFQSQNKDWELAKTCYQSAERLYSGQLFKDIPMKYIENNEDDWCWSKRFWYRDMYLKLLYSLAMVHRELGDISTALSYADRALAEDPILEGAQREKMLALAAAKRYDALKRQFKVYTNSLKKIHLDQPPKEMKNLYHALLGDFVS